MMTTQIGHLRLPFAIRPAGSVVNPLARQIIKQHHPKRHASPPQTSRAGRWAAKAAVSSKKADSLPLGGAASHEIAQLKALVVDLRQAGSPGEKVGLPPAGYVSEKTWRDVAVIIVVAGMQGLSWWCLLVLNRAMGYK